MMVLESGYDNCRQEPPYSGRGDTDDDMSTALASVAVLGLKSHRFGNISRAALVDQSCATGRFIDESLPPMNESACPEIVLSPSIDPQRTRESARELKFHRVGSFGRSKCRIRRYDDHESIFFKRKLKTNGRVSKRRTPATVRDLDRPTGGDPYHGWPGYWYHRCLFARKLRPVCQIRYRRAAWVAATADTDGKP